MNIVQKIAQVCPDGFDSYEFTCYVKGWPEVPENCYEDDERDEDTPIDMEPLDTENFFIKELTDDYMIVISGGDWQDPLEVKIALIDNMLTVIEVKEPRPDCLIEKV